VIGDDDIVLQVAPPLIVLIILPSAPAATIYKLDKPLMQYRLLLTPPTETAV
jgi:hypothetical protein